MSWQVPGHPSDQGLTHSVQLGDTGMQVSGPAQSPRDCPQASSIREGWRDMRGVEMDERILRSKAMTMMTKGCMLTVCVRMEYEM